MIEILETQKHNLSCLKIYRKQLHYQLGAQQIIYQIMAQLEKADVFSSNQNHMQKFVSLIEAISVSQGLQQLVQSIAFQPEKDQPFAKLTRSVNLLASSFNPLEGPQQLADKLFKDNNNSMPEQKKYATSEIMASIMNKSGEGIEELWQNIELTQIPVEEATSQELSYSPSEIVALMINKSREGIEELLENIMKTRIEPEQTLMQPEIHQDNQFMNEDFNSAKRMKEVQKYCIDLNNQSIELIVKQTGQRQKQAREREKFYQQALSRVQNVLEKANQALVRDSFNCLTEGRQSQFKRQTENSRPLSQEKRPTSDQREIVKGSAQSQRLKSASKKGSQAGSDQFNFDLTVKTRNSKNAFKSLIKQDSLMYSAQSDFGLNPSSPRKGQSRERQVSNTQNKSLQKIDDIEQNFPNLKIMDKSHSEEFSLSNHANNNAQEGIEKQKRRAEIQKQQQQKRDESQNQQQKKDKRNQSNERKDESQNQFQIPSNLSHSHKNKGFDSPKSIREQENRQVEEHIEDNNDGFEADDEDQREFQSARYQKKDFQKIFKKRLGTEVAVVKNSIELPKKNTKRFNKIDFTQIQKQSSVGNSRTNIFSTQIATYHSKIAKIKEIKEMKKKKLQQQLQRVNYEIKILHEKQEQLSPQNLNNYVSRVQISDNQQAKKKAESLVKSLRSQKRSRNMAKIGQFKSLDRNINDYMEELTKLRGQNAQKIKQKKKLEILERMKQAQIRKMNDRKKIQANQQFVMQLKSPAKETESVKKDAQSPKKSRIEEVPVAEQLSSLTPELSQKKAYLNKIRSFSVNKNKRDLYEQMLG